MSAMSSPANASPFIQSMDVGNSSIIVTLSDDPGWFFGHPKAHEWPRMKSGEEIKIEVGTTLLFIDANKDPEQNWPTIYEITSQISPKPGLKVKHSFNDPKFGEKTFVEEYFLEITAKAEEATPSQLSE